jgi:hypothetical protein
VTGFTTHSLSQFFTCLPFVGDFFVGEALGDFRPRDGDAFGDFFSVLRTGDLDLRVGDFLVDIAVIEGLCLVVGPLCERKIAMEERVSKSRDDSSPRSSPMSTREEYFKRFRILRELYPQLHIPIYDENTSLEEMECSYRRIVLVVREEEQRKNAEAFLAASILIVQNICPKKG